MSRPIQRRALIKAALIGAAAVPLKAQLLRTAQAQEADAAPILAESSPTAKALAYVADATKVDVKAYPNYRAGQTCLNCSEYLGDPGDPKGGCNLVVGEYVLAAAWCKAWAQKPGG